MEPRLMSRPMEWTTKTKTAGIHPDATVDFVYPPLAKKDKYMKAGVYLEGFMSAFKHG